MWVGEREGRKKPSFPKTHLCFFYSGTRISMTLCSLCAAIHHGHSCIYADVLFGRYCQKGVTEESPCSPSPCPWRSTCCWNQKESSTEPHRSGYRLLPPWIHTPRRGAGDPGTTLTQPFAFVQWQASLKLGWGLLALLRAAVSPRTEESQPQAAGCAGGGRAGKAPRSEQTQELVLPCFVQPSLKDAAASFGIYSTAC